MKKSNLNPPKYIRLGGSTEMVLREEENIYWRDAGQWGIGYKWDGGLLLSDSSNLGKDFKYLNNLPITEITEKEWCNGNGRYV